MTIPTAWIDRNCTFLTQSCKWNYCHITPVRTKKTCISGMSNIPTKNIGSTIYANILLTFLIFYLIQSGTAFIRSETKPSRRCVKQLSRVWIKLSFIWNVPWSITANLSHWIECQRELKQSRNFLMIRKNKHTTKLSYKPVQSNHVQAL